MFMKPWELKYSLFNYDIDGGDGGSELSDAGAEMGEAPVDPGVVEGAAAPVEPALTSPTKPDPAPEPEPAPKPLPNIPGYANKDNEVDWLRNAVAQLSGKLQHTEQALAQYELAGLDEGEAQTKQLSMQRDQMQQRLADLEDTLARRTWQDYYSGWGAPNEVIQGDDPLQWQHQLLAWFHQEREKLAKENKALQGALTKQKAPGTQAPKIGAQGGPGPGKRALHDMSDDEFEVLLDKARWGNIDLSEFPSVG
jgi:hypothetical protein